MRKIRNTVIGSLLVAALAATMIPGGAYTTKGGEDVKEYGISYEFANNDAGNAYGTISLTTEDAGTYELYWADDKGEKLEYEGVKYSELTSVETTESKDTATYKVVSKYTAIPDGAKQLIAVDKDGNTDYTYDIPEEKQFNLGEMKYAFAVMGDVHFNRYSDYSKDDAVPAFDNALKFINNIKIDYLFLTGDLSDQGEVDSYNKFNSALNKYPNLTAYTCTGNHDISWTKNQEEMAKVFAKHVNTKRTTDKNMVTVAENGLDFIYKKGDEYYIFLSQTRANYNNKNVQLLADDQLNWLHKNLNKYADKKVYLFYHTYMAASNGDVTLATGNLQTPLGYTYDLTYLFGNKDEVRLRTLLNMYPNVTMFNGHSHWAYEEQIYNDALNIGNVNPKGTGGSIVHIASVTAPRTAVTDKELYDSGKKRYENNGEMSEGTIALRYDKATVYISTDFKNGAFLAFATYVDKDGKMGTPEAEITTGNTKIKSVSKVKKVKKFNKKKPKYQVKIKFAKVTPVYKYQIDYSTSKTFKASVTKSKKTTATSYTITGLKPGKRYYIRVRAYQYQFGYQIFGKCAKVKSVKTPKKK